MSAGTLNLEADRGQTFILQMLVEDDAAPINFTDYTALMQIREHPEAEDIMLELASPDDIVLDALGHIDLTIPAAITEEMVPAIYSYDLRLEDGEGIVKYLVRGQFRIRPTNTRLA